jgi:hypothetical protein
MSIRSTLRFIERAAVRQAGQRVGLGALLGFVQGVADGIEFAALLDKTRLQLGGARSGLRELAHQTLDQQFRIGPGLASLGDVADGLHVRPVVGNGRGQKLLRRGHHRMQLLRSLVRRRLIGALRPDVGFKQTLVCGGVEFAFVGDQNVDRTLQLGRCTQRVFEPDLKIVRGRRDALPCHGMHGLFRDRTRVLEIELVKRAACHVSKAIFWGVSWFLVFRATLSHAIINRASRRHRGTPGIRTTVPARAMAGRYRQAPRR